MSMIYVVPAAGARVRQAERQSRVMPAEGAWVPNDAHYQRLVATGDVVPADAPKKAPAVAPAAAPPPASFEKPARPATETGRSTRRAASEE